MYSLCRLRPAGPDRSPFVIDFNVHIRTGQTDRQTGELGWLVATRGRQTDGSALSPPPAEHAMLFLRVLRVAAAARPDAESRHGHRER